MPCLIPAGLALLAAISPAYLLQPEMHKGIVWGRDSRPAGIFHQVLLTAFFSEAEELKIHPSLFLLLLILGRLYPSPMDGASSALSMAPFVPFIIR